MKRFLALIFCIFFSCMPAISATLDEMIGQMIIVGFNGNTVRSRGFQRVLKQVKRGEISGVIFFEDNIKNKEEFLKMTSAIKNSGAKYIPFISIDMEGGRVQRMNSDNGFEDFKTARAVSRMSLDEAYIEYFNMAYMLRNADINFNFGPVVDLSLNKNSIIEQKRRSYSADPKVTSDYARMFVRAHYENKIITSLKHFPGHGSPAGDTHEGFVDSTNTYISDEMTPYFLLSHLNPMQTVLVSHVYNKGMDDTYPASLSYKTIEKYLRRYVNFHGVVITDDLDMGAIKNNYTLSQIVTLAIFASDDVLLFSNRVNPNKHLARDINNCIKEGIKSGEISEKNVEDSFKRIVKLKETLE